MAPGNISGSTNNTSPLSEGGHRGEFFEMKPPDPRSVSQGEVADEAATAVGVVPAVVQLFPLELVAEGVGGGRLHAVGQRCVGDHLVAAGVVALVDQGVTTIAEVMRTVYVM